MMDTIATRKNIGFSKDTANWNKSSANYDDHTLKISGHPVMEDWEDIYMKELASLATMRGGRVLEVGFGMGISAGYILKSKQIKEHVVIECHPDVIKNAIRLYSEDIASGRLHIFSGFWQAVTPYLQDQSFDGILFDTYPLTEEEIHKNHFWFFKEAYRLLKTDGIFTYYSDEATSFSESHLAKLQEAGFSNISHKIIPVSPPEDCEYWQEKTIIAPIILKTTS